MKFRALLLPLAGALLLACGDDSATDAGDDASADATTQDAIGQDVVVKDAAPDGNVQDGASGDASDGGASDAATDAIADAAADGSASFECTSTGGTIATGLCCKNTSDFPSTCTTGPCGCSPQNSHNVQTCQCPQGKCYTQQLGCH